MLCNTPGAALAVLDMPLIDLDEVHIRTPKGAAGRGTLKYAASKMYMNS